jgi:3-phytase/alkaline phosphatase D
VRITIVSVLVAGAVATGAPSAAGGPLELEFLGEDIVATGTTFAGTQVGGLSGIVYDKQRDVYHTLSDDQTQARYYTLRVDATDGTLDGGDVEFVAVTTLRGADGQPFPPASLDPEGIALTKDDELVITSEGFANRLIDPFVRRFDLAGDQLGELPVPVPFLPDAAQTRGVRLNLGFESAVTASGGRFLYTASEAALVQDGPPATVGAGSPARLVRFNLRKGRVDRQFLYWTDPIAEPPAPPGSFAVNGLVELLPLDRGTLLAMERSFSVGAPDTGNTIKLYTVSLEGADDINGIDSLAGRLDAIDAVDKTLVLDLDDVGIPLDNVEGMTFGPRLPDGRRSLLLVSDNNFSPAAFTQFLLFAVDR